MQLDLTKVPFSRFGSYLAFAQQNAYDGKAAGLYLRSVHAEAAKNRELFRLSLLHAGQPVNFEAIAEPRVGVLKLEVAHGSAEIGFATPDIISFELRGVGLRLEMTPGWFDNAIKVHNPAWLVNSFSHKRQYLLTPLVGTLEVIAPWHVDGCTQVVADFLPDASSGVAHGVIEECLHLPQPRDYGSLVANGVQSVQTEYGNWLARFGTDLADADELACYILWANVVAPQGNLTRPALYMSKNWMTQVWSWDNCFNTIGLAASQPELAWQQYMLIFDKQAASGVLPDSVTDSTVEWNFCKPPVHGWTLGQMMEANSAYFNAARLSEIYHPLGRWTDWWFGYRDFDGNGLPEYTHGNDSGWDNGTVFASGAPVESPDLCAFLVCQMDVLAEIARKLGKESDARAWTVRADKLLSQMLSDLWQENHFVARHTGRSEFIESGSALMYMPLILGDRLPPDVRAKLVAGLKRENAFLTEWGLATENTQSKLFDPKGYWRGSIWSPVTLLLVDGLRRCGESEFAREISRRFCRMVTLNGFSENYNTLTGEALCDPAYSWSAAVFLTLKRYEEIG
jgi:putative isomerase